MRTTNTKQIRRAPQTRSDVFVGHLLSYDFAPAAVDLKQDHGNETTHSQSIEAFQNIA